MELQFLRHVDFLIKPPKSDPCARPAESSVSAFPPESDMWACPSAGCPYPAELLSGNESPPRFARFCEKA